MKSKDENIRETAVYDCFKAQWLTEKPNCNEDLLLKEIQAFTTT